MAIARLASLNEHFKPRKVKVEIEDKVAVVILSPPTKVTVLGQAILHELCLTLELLEKDDAVSVVVLTGGQGATFGAGADITGIAKMDSKYMLFDDLWESDWYRVLPTFRKPLIAAINGVAFGGGLEVAMMADILLCTEKAQLGLPEVNLGLITGGGGVTRLRQAVGKSKASEMLLTGEPILGTEALKLGLVSRVYSDKDSLLAGALAMAKKIASKSQMAAGYTKRAIRQSLEAGET